MKVQVFKLFFRVQDGGVYTPVDGELHALAVKYAADNMAEKIDFLDYKDSWVACEVDNEGKPTRALGILCLVMRPDVPVCRFTDNAAVMKLVGRANDYLHDQGVRGGDVTVHIATNELPEQRCPDREKWMEVFGMKPADRWLFTIR